MSQKSSGYERIAGDRYFTPAWVVEALLQVERFDGLVIDPAAGGWGIVDALGQNGVLAMGFDIEGPTRPQSWHLPWHKQDFFEWRGDLPPHSAPTPSRINIVTNPPYGMRGRDAVSFIINALHHTRETKGKVAMLLRVDFDSAKSRRPIFGGHMAFKAKYPILRRIHWSNVPEKFTKTGTLVQPSENHAWFVWDWKGKPNGTHVYGYL